MAIAIPEGCWVQKDVTKGVDENGNATLRYPIKGGYDALEGLMATLTKSTVVVTGFLASTWELQRVPSGGGLLTINCVADAGSFQPDPEKPETEPKPLDDIWTLRGVRNDVSILAYCGPSEGNNPSRLRLECWMKESDKTLADNDSYRAADGRVIPLLAADKAIAAKIRKGIESVIRFYPVVTRTRVYADCPPKCLENLGLKDTPPAPAGDAKKPSGLATAVEAYDWLKMQDDAIEQTDGKWSRVESWWGVTPNDGGWDDDLYGANRWPMPYEPPQQGQS